MAEFLQQNASIQARLDPSGRVGEFTVLLNGEPVIRKRWIRFPSKEDIIALIRQET